MDATVAIIFPIQRITRSYLYFSHITLPVAVINQNITA